MKKTIAILLAALLLLTGCQGAVNETTSVPETTETSPEMTVPETMTLPTIPTSDSISGTPEGEKISFANTGKTRIAYTGPRSFVMYVTSVEKLPDQEALKDYDEAFFAEHALLVVVETVTSGSVQLELGSIYREGDIAMVKLNRTMPGEVGTSDMATWLLWAEVSRDLDCSWFLDSGAKEPQSSKY